MTLAPVACTPGVPPPTAKVSINKPTKTIPVSGARRLHRFDIRRTPFRAKLIAAGLYNRDTKTPSAGTSQLMAGKGACRVRKSIFMLHGRIRGSVRRVGRVAGSELVGV